MSTRLSPIKKNDYSLGLSPSRRPGYQRPNHILSGYTGSFQTGGNIADELDQHFEVEPIVGYTGHIPCHRQSPLGKSFSPKEDSPSTQSPQIDSADLSTFRKYASDMDIYERYSNAVQRLQERGQSPEMLLKIVQAKLSERVNSYSQQTIRTRKLFEAFDFNKDGVLDENEFRECLEKINIQFDDIQCLAIFSYFDEDNTGTIDWEHFAQHALVQNPKGGTAVLPKMIISLHKEMRLITHNMLQCNVKGVSHGYPLRLEDAVFDVIPMEFDADSVAQTMRKLNYEALVSAAKDLNIDVLNKYTYSLDIVSNLDFLRDVHHVLYEVDVNKGLLVCPESGRKFMIENGIPNMILLEDEI